MGRSGLSAEIFRRIETLVDALLDLGNASISGGIQPPSDIQLFETGQSGQAWLRVKSNYSSLCSLLNPSHSEKNFDARRKDHNEIRYSLKILKDAGLLKPPDEDDSNSDENLRVHFVLMLSFVDKAESRSILRSRLCPSDPIPAQLGLDIDAQVRRVRQQLNGIIQQEYGQIRVFGIPHPVNVESIYTQTDVWQQIIHQRSQTLFKFLQLTYSSEHLNRFGIEAAEPPRYSGWKAAENFRRLMVLGKPGIGKTTYIQYLSVQCIKGTFQSDKVPIFVQLSQLERAISINPNESLLNFIHSILNRWSIDVELIEPILESGRALLLFDGLDEVFSVHEELLTSHLNQFIAQYPKNSFIITCRVAADRYRFARENFTEIEVADFDREQVKSFIRLWFKALSNVQPEIEEQAEILITTLDQPKHHAIRDLAVTPLMLNLICTVFRDAEKLPSVQSKLYERGIDALLKDWDRHRHVKRDEIYPNWNKVQTLELLLKIAQMTFEQSQFLFEQRQAERLTQAYLETMELASANTVYSQEASKVVLTGIAAHHGLLVYRATEVLSFSHLTFHEYFTARSIYLKQDWQLLLSQICNPQWREIFLLVTEMQLHSDDLICRMMQQIQKTFATDAKLQQLLSWANEMATKVAKFLPYKHSALRAWYLCLIGCNFDEGVESFRRSGRAMTDYHAFSLSRSMGLDVALADDISNLNFLYRRLCDALSLVAEEEIATELMSALLYFFQNCLLNGLLPVILPIKALLLQLDNLTSSSQQDLFLRWWHQDGQKWALHVLEKYRSLKEEMDERLNWILQQMDEAQKNALKRYYDANLLLLDCMERAEFANPSVQETIKTTLLLPSAMTNSNTNFA